MIPARRIFLRASLPPLLGTTIVASLVLPDVWRFVMTLVVVGIYAYLIVGLPSLLYALLMELAGRRGCEPGSARSYGLSAGLGALVTIGVFGLIRSGVSAGWAQALAIFALFGGSVGLGVEGAIHLCERRARRRLTDSPSSP